MHRRPSTRPTESGLALRDAAARFVLTTALCILVMSAALCPTAIRRAAAAAEIPCTRPVPPACLTADVTFADGSRMRSCRAQLLLYVDAVKTYLRCLADEHYRVEKEMQESIRGFNCRLAGQTDCL